MEPIRKLFLLQQFLVVASLFQIGSYDVGNQPFSWYLFLFDCCQCRFLVWNEQSWSTCNLRFLCNSFTLFPPNDVVLDVCQCLQHVQSLETGKLQFLQIKFIVGSGKIESFTQLTACFITFLIMSEIQRSNLIFVKIKYFNAVGFQTSPWEVNLHCR